MQTWDGEVARAAEEGWLQDRRQRRCIEKKPLVINHLGVHPT